MLLSYVGLKETLVYWCQQQIPCAPNPGLHATGFSSDGYIFINTSGAAAASALLRVVLTRLWVGSAHQAALF